MVLGVEATERAGSVPFCDLPMNMTCFHIYCLLPYIDRFSSGERVFEAWHHSLYVRIL
jgi:hypothetical protein